MAETLGSLIDKLSIKSIRLWHMQDILQKDNAETNQRFAPADIEIVKKQIDELSKEIDEFIIFAKTGLVSIRDQKLKLYNRPEDMNKYASQEKIGEVVNLLAQKNLELWRLEDAVRATNISDSEVAQLKRKIDIANQERNDLIDKIDELLGKSVTQCSMGGVS